MKKVLIFAGTSEGRELSELLSHAGIAHTVCVATGYGGMMIEGNDYADVHCGRMDDKQIGELMEQGAYELVADATHPYAYEVTENIRKAVRESKNGIRYIRLKRDTQSLSGEGNILYFDNSEDCAAALEQTEGNILLTTGTKELSVYATHEKLKGRLYARVIPSEESIRLCNEAGIFGKNIIAMQGPFDCGMNEAMIDMFDIRHMVSKQSGTAGGFTEKVLSTGHKNIPLYVIGCKETDEGCTFEEAVSEIEKICKVSVGNKGKEDTFISLIGVGMGNPDGLTLEAKQAVYEADVLIGAARLLQIFEDHKGVKHALYLPKDVLPLIQKIQKEEKKAKKIAVLFSGDASFFSGADAMNKALSEAVERGEITGRVRILPGISSVAYLSAKTGISYSDAVILSMHGRELNNMVRRVMHLPKIFVLLSGAEDVRNLSEKLTAAGLGDVKITLGKNLSYADEKIVVYKAAECVNIEKGLYIACIENANATVRAVAPDLADEVFVREKTPMTKEEVREVSICKLKLNKSSVLWDIGSGTGSISVQSALLSDEIDVYAIERKEDACRLTKENADRFFLENVHCICGTAPEVFANLPKPSHAFIGGSGGNLEEILQKLYEINAEMRIVINAVSIETISEMRAIPERFPVRGFEVVQLQISRSGRVGEYHLMKAENPIWICSFSFERK